MTTIGKKKLVNSLWSLVYLALVIAIVVSATSIFKNFYYESVYVSGSSMDPTFCGVDKYDEQGEIIPSHDYGVIDKDYGAKKNIKRYQVVTTYYPGDPSDRHLASYKIKRVLAKPGDTFKIVDNNIYLYNKATLSWGEPLDIPFERSLPSIPKSYRETTLDKDEYFLAGDNWANSYDSFDIGPINFDLLVGVVVKMEGRCVVQNGKVIEKEKYNDGNHFFLGVDY